MKRARQSHQKRERRAAILAAALNVLQGTPFRDITMNQVAEQAGLVKGTLYLYFATKEELFLELLRDQLHGWFWELEAGLELLPRRGRLEAAARLLAGTAQARPMLRTLLGASCERTLPDAAAFDFQREWSARTLAMGRCLERSLTFLAPGHGARFLHQACALLIGLQALAVPVRSGGQAPEDPPFPDDFHLGAQALLRELKRAPRPLRGGSTA